MRPEAAAPLTSTADPTVELIPVTDCDLLFSSGQRFSCTIKDSDHYELTADRLVIDFASPVEHIEVSRVHVAMITLRPRTQARRIKPDGR